MAGLCATLNNRSIHNMTNNLLTTPNLEVKDTYSDENIAISQVSLKKNLFKCFQSADIVIFIEGYCYNLDELGKLFNIIETTFAEQLFWAYKNNQLKKYCNKVNGFYHATIYDKTKKKILLISDRLGTRFVFYYYKDNYFAFSGEVKGLLALDEVDKTIDTISAECFVNGGPNFYLLDDNTHFNYIKLLKPSTILEYNIEESTLSQEYYWKWSEIKPQEISYEDAINILHELIEDAVLKRMKHINLNDILLPLSGGLDSRLIFAILNNHHKVPKFIFTNGSPKCTDVVFAKKLCKKYGYSHYINSPQSYSNYIENGSHYAYRPDGMVFFIEFGTYLPFLDYHYSITGYVGDMIFGASFKDDAALLDKKMTQDLAEKLYGKFYELSDYKNDFYEINKIEPSLFMNRVRRYTTQMINVGLNHSEPILPYIDNKIIDFIYSIPDEYRANNNLYSDMLLKYYNEYYKNIPWTANNLPIQGKLYKNNKFNINMLREKVINSTLLSKKWKRSILKRINIYNLIYKPTFHVFQEELAKDENINLIKEKYINERSLCMKYLSKETIDVINNSIKYKNTWQLALILTYEFYLRDLEKRGYLK